MKRSAFPWPGWFLPWLGVMFLLAMYYGPDNLGLLVFIALLSFTILYFLKPKESV